MNGVITEILDPNILYSRISFLESSKDAIDIKNSLSMGKKMGFQQYKLPSIADKYYTRSCMIKQFYDESSEGRIRAKFSDNLDSFKANLKQREDKMRQNQKIKAMIAKTTNTRYFSQTQRNGEAAKGHS